jgi:Lrp/AsnC family leucine-responsive transcriptional regulator
VAGVESYIVKVRVASPAALEALLAQIRGTAGLSTRTTVVLSTPYENRPVTPAIPAEAIREAVAGNAVAGNGGHSVDD